MVVVLSIKRFILVKSNYSEYKNCQNILCVYEFKMIANKQKWLLHPVADFMIIFQHKPNSLMFNKNYGGYSYGIMETSMLMVSTFHVSKIDAFSHVLGFNQ